MLDKKLCKTTPQPAADAADTWLWDAGGVAGFYLRIKPSGKRTFGFQYRKGGQTRRVKIGQFPAFTPDEAREAAMEYSREVANGGDPGGRVRTERRRQPADTLEAAVKVFMATYVPLRGQPYTGPDGKLTKHGREVRRIFDEYVLPSFGDYALPDIKRADLKPLIAKIVVQNGGPMAKHVFKRLRTFFKWALSDDLITDDPTYAISPPAGEQVGSRVLEDWELALVWRAVDTFDYPRRDFLRLLVLCGQRREETAAMRASAIDRTARIWKRAGVGQTKTGAYQEVPFGDAAWATVADLLAAADAAGRDYLLVTPWSKPSSPYLQSFSDLKVDLDAAIERLHGSRLPPWKLHDLRRSMRTVMPKLGVTSEVAELCMCHTKKGVEAVYDHHAYRDEKRQAFGRWASHVAGLVNPPAATNVTSIEEERGKRNAS